VQNRILNIFANSNQGTYIPQTLQISYEYFLTDFNDKGGRENILNEKIEYENLHEIIYENGVRVLNFARLKTSWSKVQCSLITIFTNILGKPFGPENSVFSSAVEKCKGYNIEGYNFAYSFIWV
jgi:hypothetical protein